MKTIATLFIALFLSACATEQPAPGTVHNCKQHCAHMQCKHGENCACEDCKMHKKGHTCPMDAPMSTPAQ